MPIVHIATWPIENEETVRSMVEQMTKVIHETTKAPLDKISIYISEISPSRWADAGVLGTDPTFPEKSRHTSYGERS